MKKQAVIKIYYTGTLCFFNTETFFLFKKKPRESFGSWHTIWKQAQNVEIPQNILPGGFWAEPAHQTGMAHSMWNWSELVGSVLFNMIVCDPAKLTYKIIEMKIETKKLKPKSKILNLILNSGLI